MPTILKVYKPDATQRAIWRTRVAQSLREAGAIPERASRVEAVRAGPHRSKFHVDFTLLAELTGEKAHEVCLTRTFDSHEEAVAAEVRWIEHNWLLK